LTAHGAQLRELVAHARAGRADAGEVAGRVHALGEDLATVVKVPAWVEPPAP
jgi:hypothetical protein